jgi:phosphomannomutase / phosphoglucomutase
VLKIRIPDNIFRAYDIRGIVDEGIGEGLDENIILLIGRAIASEALDLGEQCLIVSADARLSSPAFSDAMIKGILSTGCNVVNIGIGPTPLMYFATHYLDVHSGVMITGSHNPKNYNGVKIVLNNNCLAADQITRLKERILSDDFHNGCGSLSTLDITPDYIKTVSQNIQLTQSHKVVIDCGNAVAGTCAPTLFSALGCQVVPLYCDTDGNFPNHHPDPTREENLRDLIALTKKENAALGIAFDGDGDRVVLVSNSGKIIDADKMMLSFIEDIVPDNPGASIIFDVKSSQHLSRMISRLGGKPVMCKSGHSFVKQQMHATGALLGGEYSAHIFFRHRWYGFDDGMYSAARFLELMDKNKVSADSLLAACPITYSTTELYVPVSEEEKFTIMDILLEKLDIPGAQIKRLDGIRAETENAWGLIRASNTTPNLVLRFEADSASALEQIQVVFKQAISAFFPALDLDFPVPAQD